MNISCGICGHKGDMNEYAGRPNAICPVCGSLERHRSAWEYLAKLPDLCFGKRLLHVAPEVCLRDKFRSILGGGYFSIDLDGRNGADRMDLSAMTYPDGIFDFVFCSHVLEHIQDDREAIGGIARVMKPGGIAVIIVPIRGAITTEDETIDTSAGRMKAYGHEGHVRNCGEDYPERFLEAGFAVIHEIERGSFVCRRVGA